jgi:hypothetical protein
VLSFPVSDAVLLTTQASLVALPATQPPAWLRRLVRPGWALVPAGSIAVVIGVIALDPDTADFLTYLALVATPLLAAVALGTLVPRARPAYALAVVPLLAIAWATTDGSLARDATSLALTALGCLTLGWLLAAVAPRRLLKAGIVAMAVVDSVFVFGELLQGPNATLNAAAPAAGLPQLQFVSFGSAVMGYGDLFIAGVLGGVLLLDGTRRTPVALACLALAGAWDLLFFVRDDLPATVPVALALIVSELWKRLRPRAARWRAESLRPGPPRSRTRSPAQPARTAASPRPGR